MRAQRAGEIARQVEAGMVMRQRERMQAEEAQNEATRLLIVDELQAIEEAAEGRKEGEEEEPWDIDSSADPNIPMNQRILDKMS